jgi:hypothetical protein
MSAEVLASTTVAIVETGYVAEFVTDLLGNIESTGTVEPSSQCWIADPCIYERVDYISIRSCA